MFFLKWTSIVFLKGIKQIEEEESEKYTKYSSASTKFFLMTHFYKINCCFKMGGENIYKMMVSPLNVKILVGAIFEENKISNC